MKTRTLLSFIFVLLSVQITFSQNYLRVIDPNEWWATASNIPGWEENQPHGLFDDIDIVLTPKGVYTEVELYVSILNFDNYWSNLSEIVWQFNLPAQAIVHDSWLWVGDDIIKADVVDYWTALQTYEGIVGRNEDPSFFYILSDNRYEIRIFPVQLDESRKIKMTFLLPANWNENQVTQGLLQHMFQSTDLPLITVSLSVAVDETWGTPVLYFDEEEVVMDEIVTAANDLEYHFLEIDADAFATTSGAKVGWNAPFSNDDDVFVGTFQDEGEQYYQLAYVPNWEEVVDNSEPEKSLFLIDYDADKTSVSLSDMTQILNEQMAVRFTDQDMINVGVTTTQGIALLAEDWILVDNADQEQQITDLLLQQDTSDLAQLLSDGMIWLENNGAEGEIYLFCANDEYVYPPVAEEAFYTIQGLINGAIPLNIFDFQNENVSVLYYNDEVYYGNSYFYNLLEQSFVTTEMTIFRNQNSSFGQLLQGILPSPAVPTGILDYNVSLENGICYDRYTITNNLLDEENNGVLLQTGKYLGDLPFEIEGFLISDMNQFANIQASVTEEEVVQGDSLMRTMWYGSDLRNKNGLISSLADRLELIELSIIERILTPLTAFLALEPGQGGEICIECLLNSGEGGIIFTTNEVELDETDVLIKPNPIVDEAVIQLTLPEGFYNKDWSAAIYDLTGRKVAMLPKPTKNNLSLEWVWTLNDKVAPGMYFCKIQSGISELTVKLLVVK